MILPLNIKHVELVNALLETGMWGNSAKQVVMRLFDSACAAHAKGAE